MIISGIRWSKDAELGVFDASKYTILEVEKWGEYTLLIDKEATYHPIILAYGFVRENQDIVSWASGHYFETISDAYIWFENSKSK